MSYVMILHPMLIADVLSHDGGAFLKAFDFDAGDGYGEAEFTSDFREAMRFPSRDEALRYWWTISPKRPRREDGKPNRPLRAWTVTVAPLSDFTTQEREVQDG